MTATVKTAIIFQSVTGMEEIVAIMNILDGIQLAPIAHAGIQKMNAALTNL